MTDEEFIKQFGKPFMDLWRRDIDNVVLMVNPDRIKDCHDAEQMLREVFADDDATFSISRDDFNYRAILIEVRFDIFVVRSDKYEQFLTAILLSDSIEICASYDGSQAVMNLEFQNCFVPIGKTE